MITPKARSLLLRSHSTGRDIASFDERIEKEVISLGYATYTTKPLLRLTYDGKAYCRKEAMKRGK